MSVCLTVFFLSWPCWNLRRGFFFKQSFTQADLELVVFLPQPPKGLCVTHTTRFPEKHKASVLAVVLSSLLSLANVAASLEGPCSLLVSGSENSVR